MHEKNSSAESLAFLPASEQTAALKGLSNDQASKLLYDWQFWARPNQLEPPGNWQFWLVLAGRGFGKTRIGSEFVRSNVERKKARRIALVAQDAADARDVMVEGDSGILTISPPGFRPRYEPSKRRLTWPNGATATTFSAQDYEALRGPQHDLAWCDEVGKWRYPQQAWDNLMLGLRGLGGEPRCCITTTPRPISLIRALHDDPRTHLTVGSTYENRANVSASFFDYIVKRYEGTRLARQEIHAELLADVEGALWTLSLIDRYRVRTAPEMRRVVVGVDPAATSNEQSDETGIVVAGLGVDGDYYIRDDRSGRFSPLDWARRAVDCLGLFEGDKIIGEGNNGGEMVEQTIRTVMRDAPFRLVHASRGKAARAEPIAALYEQGRVHHVGSFAQLEDEMTTWDAKSGSRSPSRMDALVWAMTELSRPRGVPLVGVVEMGRPAGIGSRLASASFPHQHTNR